MKLSLPAALLLCAALVTTSSSTGQKAIFSSGNSGEMKIALTFDDGPHPKYTPMILDILAKYNAKATFFTIGVNAETYHDLILREYTEGHEIGDHTYSHKRLCKLSSECIIREITRCSGIIEDLTGEPPSLLRPPEGAISDRVIAEASSLNMKIVLWNIDTEDWKGLSSEKIIKTVKNSLSPGSIILFHDYVSGASGTPEALETLIPYIMSLGYELVSVSELIADS